MGTYVYTLRAKKKEIVLTNGEKVLAHLLKYSFKVGWDNACIHENLMLGRAATYWEDKEFPDYVVEGDDFIDGSTVYKNYKGGSSVYDSADYGEMIGYLRDGKVVPKAELLRDHLIDDVTACSLWHDFESERYIMTNGLNKHTLAVASTDEERLNAHWEGFVENTIASRKNLVA